MPVYKYHDNRSTILKIKNVAGVTMHSSCMRVKKKLFLNRNEKICSGRSLNYVKYAPVAFISRMATGGLKKTWRNSACLILACGAFKYNTRPILRTSLQAVNPAAFTPVCLQDLQTPSRDKLEFLLVKRSDVSSFMVRIVPWGMYVAHTPLPQPSNHVFPGGVLDPADFAPQWMSLFNSCAGEHPFASIPGLGTPLLTRPHLYSSLPSGSSVPGEVAFRICAIREVFEEAGILLARDQSDVPNKLGLVAGSFAPAVKQLPLPLMEEWRDKIHNNAQEFVNLCRYV